MKTHYTPARARHMAALESLSKNTSPMTGEQIWLWLRRIERAISRATEAACNNQEGVNDLPEHLRQARDGVKKALGYLPQGFFINTDPRGYALKIDNDKVPLAIEGLHRDNGGYYILAPEF